MQITVYSVRDSIMVVLIVDIHNRDSFELNQNKYEQNYIRISNKYYLIAAWMATSGPCYASTNRKIIVCVPKVLQFLFN